MSKFLNKRYMKLESYKPGEQPKNPVYVKLNTNESPYPPGPMVIEAINKELLNNLRLYSDPTSSRLKEKLAEKYGVKSENIFVANGSDDILNFAFMAFSDEDRPVMFPEITYGFYKVFAELYGVPYTKVPLSEGFEIDRKDYTAQNKMIVIANPNAPTGRVLKLFEIEEIVRTNPENIVVIDEAYIDFGAESCVDLIFKYDNLLVVRTFSKSRSLAGARLGFAVGSASVISDLEKLKYSTNPYNVNSVTEYIGIAALEEDDYYIRNCERIMETRKRTVSELEKLGFNVIPSQANFIFVSNDEISGLELYTMLKERGILIRRWDDEKIREYVRITIGNEIEMNKFITAIREILEEQRDERMCV